MARKEKLTQNEEDMRRISRDLCSAPNGKELFEEFYVKNGFASSSDWQRFVEDKN